MMKLYGEVLPRCFQLDFAQLPKAKWFISQIDLEVSFEVSVRKSQVVVTAQGETLNREHLSLIYKHAFDLVSAVVNLMAFEHGIGFSVHLDRMSWNGEESPIAPRTHELEGLCTAFTGARLEPALRLIWGEPALMLTLHDLIATLQWHSHIVTNSARVIDSLKKSIAGPDLDRGAAWEAIRTSLNVDVDYLRLISETSAGPRHGDRAWVDGATTLEISRRTWTLFDRYLHFRLGGDRPLREPDFPLLVG